MADTAGTSQPSAPPPAPQYPESDIESGKVMAILCYVPVAPLNLVVSIVCLATKNNAFSLYHAKQSLTLMIGALICSVIWCIPILGWIVAPLGWLAAFILCILGLMNAAQGKYAPVPFVGEYADKLFGSVQVEKK